MSNRWMITAAAAALIAGSGFAYAQTNMGREGGTAGGAGMHQGASPSTGAGHESSAGMKSSQQAEHEQKGSSTNRSAQRETKGAEKRTVGQSAASEKSAGEKSSQENKSDRSKGMSSQNEEKGATSKKAEERNERDGNMKAEGQQHNGNMKAEGQERNGNMKAEGRNGNMNAQGANGNATAQGNRGGVTTGQAGAGAKLSSEQRTKITSIIHGQHVAPVNNVNFPVSVGTRVPGGIGFHPLPAEIVTIYPEWRGYEYFLVRDEIVVVDPRTLEIVDVLPA